MQFCEEDQILSKALDISSASARVALDLLNTLQFYQTQLSEDLQLIEKTLNHTGNQKKGQKIMTECLFTN